MYDKSICDQRWTNAYFRSCHNKLKTMNKNAKFCGEVDVQHQQNQAVQISTRAPPKKLNAHGKFSKAMDVCKKIANILSQSSQEHFERKMQQLITLHETWNAGKRVWSYRF